MSQEQTRRHFLARATVAAAALGAAGCTASGRPDFVKFSPDGHRLAYQDAWYPGAYVYDLQAGAKHTFKGKIVCVNRRVDRFVLLPERYPGYIPPPHPVPCHLLTVDKGGISLERLADLPVTSSFAIVYLEFVPPNEDRLRAVVFEREDTHDDPPGRCFTLTPGDSAWDEESLPAELESWPAWRWGCPGGVRDCKRVYCPVLEPGALPPDEEWGIGIEKQLRNNRYEQVLAGPDGRFAVRIGDADAPWPRVTLIDLATGKKEIILEKNDAALDVLHAIAVVLCAPLSPFLPKF